MGPWSYIEAETSPRQSCAALGRRSRMSARRRILGAGVATAAFLAMNAWGADYPERPVRIIVPFAAGSGTDVVARATGAALSTRIKVPVVAENIVGAEGTK